MTFYGESLKGRLARGNCDKRLHSVYGVNFLYRAYAFVWFLHRVLVIVFDATRIIVTGR